MVEYSEEDSPGIMRESNSTVYGSSSSKQGRRKRRTINGEETHSQQHRIE